MNSWWVWAVVLILQNLSFTYVSRARNSGSLGRHVKAALFSNLIWFGAQLIVISKFMEYASGKHGVLWMILAGLFYTVFTVSGSVLAHYLSLKYEKGKAAVGANSRYAQITKEDWTAVKSMLNI